ncbi:hypothetical protein Taro_020753 [Colocasia esculenta]|uniref:Uncharacterized protein n=1 Tax=Colocasia esculenta TaxID=4460 RepID=A0A843UX60_COLES|nr:hypothetical protein [Colocasia esculenta]
MVEVFFRCGPVSPSHCLALCWFQSRVGRVGMGPQLGWAAVVVSEVESGSACGPSTLWRSEVVMPVVRCSFSRGCLVSLMVTPGCSFSTSWRSGMLGACVVRLWSHVVAPVFRELFCLDRCMPRCCFRIVFDSAGSTGVVFGPTLVVGHGVTLFRCFVVLCRVVCFYFCWSSYCSGWSSLSDGCGGGLFTVHCRQCEL